MWRRLMFLGAPALVLLTMGCQATGMGSLPSVLVAGDKATFGFVFDASGTGASFSGSYHDPHGVTSTGTVDVAFKGSGALQPCTPGVGPICAKAPANTKGGCLGGALVTYTSQNPNFPGTGTLNILVCDVDGTGGQGQDFMAIGVVTGPCMDTTPCLLPGPYSDYTNSGTPSGNITVTQ